MVWPAMQDPNHTSCGLSFDPRSRYMQGPNHSTSGFSQLRRENGEKARAGLVRLRQPEKNSAPDIFLYLGHARVHDKRGPYMHRMARRSQLAHCDSGDPERRRFCGLVRSCFGGQIRPV